MTSSGCSAVKDLSIIALEDILEAQGCIHGTVRTTPLIPFDMPTCPKKIYLKLECLQLCGCFKPRGTHNALHHALLDVEVRGNARICSASTGNFGYALVHSAKMAGVPCKIYVPDDASDMKVASMQRLGCDVQRLPRDKWFNLVLTNEGAGEGEIFINPVCNKYVAAGHASIGLEILEALPSVASVVTPWGGGALLSGVASALRHLKPDVKVYAAEPENATPLAASLKAGQAVAAPNFKPSFVDGMNGPALLPDMWSLAHNLVTDSIVVTLADICHSIRLLLQHNHVLAEGAAAATLAAALQAPLPEPIVCVISGGNIDNNRVLDILQGKIPT